MSEPELLETWQVIVLAIAFVSGMILGAIAIHKTPPGDCGP